MRTLSLFGALLVLGGCAGGRPACPSADFDGFLAAFRESESLQRAYTRAPLTYAHVVDADPEPRPVVEHQDAGAIRFPVIATASKLKTAGIEVAVRRIASGATAKEVKPEGDSWQVTYDFERAAGCWRLTSVDDESL